MSAATCPDFKNIGNTLGKVAFEYVDSQNNKQAVMIRRIFPILHLEEVNILDFK